jgi:hypothetical protein
VFYLIALLIIGVKFYPYYFNLPEVYFMVNDFIIILLIMTIKKSKTIKYFISFILICFLSFFIINELNPSKGAFYYMPITISLVLLTYIFLLRRKYDFDKLDNDVYNINKVQLLVKKPSTIWALLASFGFTMPMGSVSYVYNGNRYLYRKKNSKFIKIPYIHKEGKLFDTGIKGMDMLRRYEDLKGVKYNRLSNNCLNIFRHPKNFLKWK